LEEAELGGRAVVDTAVDAVKDVVVKDETACGARMSHRV
jgi:hypothetical protein